MKNSIPQKLLFAECSERGWAAVLQELPESSEIVASSYDDIRIPLLAKLCWESSFGLGACGSCLINCRLSGLIDFSLMDDSERTRVTLIDTDWEEAFRLYEEAIASQNEALNVRATIRLFHLSNDIPEHILARTIPILAYLLQAPSSNSNPSIQEIVICCLSRIASLKVGKLALIIGQSGAITSLLRLLPNSASSFQKILIRCLRNLVTSERSNSIILASNGGLEVVLYMLNSLSNNCIRRYLLELFSELTLFKEVRRVIVSLGGLRFLVESASCGSIKSRAKASQAIGLLGTTRRLRRMLVELNAIPVLVELLRDGDISTRIVAGNALGIISSHVDYIRLVAQSGAIPLYADLLRGPEQMGREIAEDVFCILAVAEVNAVEIMEHLVRILQEGSDESKAAAADIIWDISGYKYSLSVVQNSGAIPMLVGLLRNGSCDVREKVCGAIMQLSYNELDRVALDESSAVPILIELLEDESEDIRDNAAEALINFSEDSAWSGTISELFDVPAMRNMQNTLAQIRASDDHMVRSMRGFSIQGFTWDPALD